MFKPFSFLLILTGVILILLGIFVNLLGTTKIGRLPGDILIKRENFTLYFPLATSIILSIFLTIFLNLVIRLLKK